MFANTEKKIATFVNMFANWIFVRLDVCSTAFMFVSEVFVNFSNTKFTNNLGSGAMSDICALWAFSTHHSGDGPVLLKLVSD